MKTGLSYSEEQGIAAADLENLPTHFIEQYRFLETQIFCNSTTPLLMRFLSEQLRKSAACGIETIAIFKIYPKTKLP